MEPIPQQPHPPCQDELAAVEMALRGNWTHLKAPDRMRLWELLADRKAIEGFVDEKTILTFEQLTVEVLARVGPLDNDKSFTKVTQLLKDKGVLYPMHWRDQVRAGGAHAKDVEYDAWCTRQEQPRHFRR